MSLASERLKYTIVQLGSLEREEVDNALDLANSEQRAFDFVLHPRRFPLSAVTYRLRNGGWNLDAAVRGILKSGNLSLPLIFLTSLPYTDRDNQTKTDWLYFAEYGLDSKAISIVSTHLWRSLPGLRRPQPYVLFNLAAAVLSHTAGLQIHEETQGCVFDYCDEPADIDRAFEVKELCPDCERHLNGALRSGRMAVNQLASAKRLLNRALNRKVAFIVMPFQESLEPVHKLIKASLTSRGWHVIRADQIVQPRRITDAIIQAILVSDLVVADLTGQNPNVFYELGFANAAGCDVIMITQEKKLPFDVTVERAVFYRPSKRGFAELEKRLHEYVPEAGRN